MTIGKRRFLFAGDSLYHDKKEWRVFVSKANRKTMRATLDLLMEVEFDVLLSNTSVSNPVCSVELNDAERRSLLVQIRGTIE